MYRSVWIITLKYSFKNNLRNLNNKNLNLNILNAKNYLLIINNELKLFGGGGECFKNPISISALLYAFNII